MIDDSGHPQIDQIDGIDRIDGRGEDQYVRYAWSAMDHPVL